MTSKDPKDRESRRTSWLAGLRHRWLAGTTRTDAGYTVSELLIAMVVAGILAAIGTMVYHQAVHSGAQGVSRTTAHGSQLDASSLLARDVKEAIWLHTATETELSVSVVRDGVCWNRDYKVEDHELTLTTLYFEQSTCRGPSQARTETLLGSTVKTATRFSYFTTDNVTLTLPIDDLRGVTRIDWSFSSRADGWQNDLQYSGSSIFTGQGDHSGTGIDGLQAADRALLRVTTGAAEGAADPVLSWTDPNETGVVSGWTLLRSATPEGADASADVSRGTWQAVSPPLPAAQITWTDTTLPPGYTASYAVRPTLASGGLGAESNVVVTGLRPAAPTGLTATGHATSVTLAWNAPVGGTAIDVYRNDVLVAHVGSETTFTDEPGVYEWSGSGYGLSGYWRVASVNRWERLTVSGAQNGSVPLGTTADQAFPRIGNTRLLSDQAGAFTAPAPPTITVTPNPDWSVTISWIPAAWVGSGPTTVGGVHRDRGWVADVNASGTAAASGAWSVLWGGAENPRGTTSRVQSYTQAQIAGQYRHVRARTCNAVGCSLDSAAATALQRPPTPASCTPSGATTRSMTVTVNPATSNSPYVGYRVEGGVGSPVGGAAQEASVFTIDQLSHSTASTFTARARNDSPAAGGWSEGVTCSGTTAVLGVAITGTSSTTRTVTATMSTTNGSASSLTLEGVATHQNVAGASFDPLPDSSSFTVTARNSDGWQQVVAQRSVSTQTLTAPGAPSCSISGGGESPNGTAVLGA